MFLPYFGPLFLLVARRGPRTGPQSREAREEHWGVKESAFRITTGPEHFIAEQARDFVLVWAKS